MQGELDSYEFDGAEQDDLEWESGSDSGSEDSGRRRGAELYDRTEENMDAWSDGEEEEDDMEGLR